MIIVSPIIIQNCPCDDKRRIYISIPKEVYFNQRISNKEWRLEYSKKVKEEKYRFYKENVISSGGQWVEYNKKPVICDKCGKSIDI